MPKPTRKSGGGSDWYSVDECAAIAGVTPRTVRRLIARGELPAWRIGGKTIRIAKADMEGRLLRPLPAAEAR